MALDKNLPKASLADFRSSPTKDQINSPKLLLFCLSYFRFSLVAVPDSSKMCSNSLKLFSGIFEHGNGDIYPPFIGLHCLD